jgi:hypothetical protein
VALGVAEWGCYKEVGEGVEVEPKAQLRGVGSESGRTMKLDWLPRSEAGA